MSSRAWVERLHRLQGMSQAELRERVRQELYKRVDLIRFHLRSNRPTQVLENWAATANFFFYPEQLSDLVMLLRERLSAEVQQIIARAEKIRDHKFDLLGYENLNYGREIDWHLDRVHGKRAPRKPWYKLRYLDFAEVGDVKVTWELNRHQHLVTLAKAYRLTEDERLVKELFAQWYHWVDENPYPIGVNWASSLEVGFRSISWLWVKHLLAGTPVVPGNFDADLRNALAISGRHIERYLSTFFSPNTHLLGEAVALFFIGTLCPELSRAEKWKQLGWQIVLQEAERQVRPDGLHFEQSVYYHVYALDFFLHATLLAARNNVPIPSALERVLEKMMEVLRVLSRTGISHQFGDDDGGRLFDPRRNRAEHLADPLATGAVLFGRSDFKATAKSLREETIWLVGAEGAKRFDQLSQSPIAYNSTEFRDSGVYVMAQGGEAPAQMLIDAGPQGAHRGGHGHADALSVQVSHATEMLLMDPGTCEYIGDKAERTVFRGTAAHNTLQIDDHDQSEPKGPFSWVRLTQSRVDQWQSGENFDLFAGSHDGYAVPPSPVIHRRWVFYRKPDFWMIRDVAEGSGKHHLALHWHLAPGMGQANPDKAFFVPRAGELGVAFVMPASSRWMMKVDKGNCSPCYGKQEPACVLKLEAETGIPAEFATVIVPTKNAADLGQLTFVQENPRSQAIVGYRYSIGRETHAFFFGSGEREWRLGRWSSDAEFLYCRQDERGMKEIIFCSGSYVAFSGRRVVSARVNLSCCELSESGLRKVVSPKEEMIVLHHWPQVLQNEKRAKLESARMGS